MADDESQLEIYFIWGDYLPIKMVI